MKKVFSIMALCALFAGCDTANVGYVCSGPQDCEEFPAIGYCEQGFPMEGNKEILDWTSYVCDHNGENCEGIYFPRLDYGSCRLSMGGYLNFTPQPCNRTGGMMVGEVYGLNSCDTSAVAETPYFGVGSYELYEEDDQLFVEFKSYEFHWHLIGRVSNVNRNVTMAARSGEAYILFDHVDGTPALDVRIRQAGKVTACLEEEEPYYPSQPYGYCYASTNCSSLMASCLTKQSCIWALKGQGLTFGSWLDRDTLDCKQVEVPTPDQPWW